MVSEITWGALPWRKRVNIKNNMIRSHGHVCNRCKKTVSYYTLTIDHIYPIYLGGPVEDVKNLQLLCARCHAVKTRHEQPAYL